MSGGGGGTRLDRLLNLLEVGTTLVTRKTAAQQIGEIQKYHSYDLQSLLLKVGQYLKKESWDARTAAGFAIEAIAKNVPLWDPQPPASTNSSSSTIDASKDAVLNNADKLSFADFDLNKVLSQGVPLLASGRDFDAEVGDMDPKEKIEQQRRKINKRFGMEAANFMNDIIDDADLLVEKQTEEDKKRKKEEKAEAEKKAAELAATLKVGMSARERNRLKRKAKELEKGKTKKGKKSEANDESSKKKQKVKTVVTDQPQAENKVIIEAIPSAIDEDLDEWPFQSFTSILMNDLFNPCWEVRHGSGIGLREILKRHAKGAGKRVGFNPDEQIQLNRQWLVDCSIRLLCVLALDRFGDYVSDQVVAPVRETCAQALGVVLQSMDTRDVLVIYELLVQLQSNQQWEVRHGGLLGLKYLVAVRKDLIPHILPKTLPIILQALGDKDDDVRAVAAETLLPVFTEVYSHATSQIALLINTLWDSLLYLDDLTASTSSILSLLSEFYNLSLTGANKTDVINDRLSELTPRLWPFMRHNITVVRKAAIATFTKLLSSSDADFPCSKWLDPILSAALKYVYQNLVLETNEEILGISFQAWEMILVYTEQYKLCNVSHSCLRSWLCLLTTPTNLPIDTSLIFTEERANISDSAAPTISFNAEDEYVLLRVNGAKAIEMQQQITNAYSYLLDMLNSSLAVNQYIAALIISEFSRYHYIQSYRLSVLIPIQALLPELVFSRLIEIIEKDEEESAPAYFEVAGNYEKLQAEYDALIYALTPIADPIPLPSLSSSISISSSSNSSSEMGGLTIAKALELATETVDSIIAKKKKDTSIDFAAIEARRKRCLATIGALDTALKKYIVTIKACVASAILDLSFSGYELPHKITPIVQSLMNSIQSESFLLLQKRSGESVAKMVWKCINRTPNPSTKIFKNLISYLCVNKSKTPHLVEDEDEEQFDNFDVVLRGAEIALREICFYFKESLITSLPNFWNLITSPIKSIKTDDLNTMQSAINAMAVLICILKDIDKSLHDTIISDLLSAVIELIPFPKIEVQQMTAKCMAALASEITIPTMNAVLEKVLPMLSDLENENARIGAVETIQLVITQLEINVVSYSIFLLVPLLGRMTTDKNKTVRDAATLSFASLIKILPLESGIPDPIGLPSSLVSKRSQERKFIEQLMDSSKIEPYRIPPTVKAELRKYQQEGVNWLSFLNKYKLHGILCDDMGLGKTLQSLCIVSGDAYEREQATHDKAAPASADAGLLPSLVVCPPTVVGHWAIEVNRFCTNLVPIAYFGPPAERMSLRKQIKGNSIVILSYDILRNDIEHFKGIKFNYCILDEGHIIRNAKTKITKATKEIQANHRLILSGTPIQNNVIELWSLFDFLMPGFLGSEKEFNEKYGKAILASKDPKCTPKEQEAASLALEALHRQVLPFLLRRLKENVLQDLPPKIIQDYYCDLSPLQLKLYEDFAKGHFQQSISESIKKEQEPKTKDQAGHIFQALQYLRKLCNHPLLVLTKDHPKYKSTIQELESKKSTIRDLQHAPKLLALKELLHECGIGSANDETKSEDFTVSQHRVLIFCQLKSMLDIIENDLFKAVLPDVTYLRLDGSVPAVKRQNIVNKFNEDPTIDVLLLTTHVGGLGLNLTGADTVIFVEHDWNPMKDLQAMDRAHRIGQKKVVNVYRLITRGTLEEKIMGLQKFKLHLANSVVNQDNMSLRTMDTQQLLDLFTPPSKASSSSTSSKSTSSTETAGEAELPKSKGLKSVLEELGELWDTSQYEEEYNVNAFLSALNTDKS